MTARDLLELAQATGVEVLTENGKLVLRGDEFAIASLVPEAKAHKTELLDELKRLPEDLVRCIERVAAFHGFTRDELREAKEIAAGDVENALTCFRALKGEIERFSNVQQILQVRTLAQRQAEDVEALPEDVLSVP